MTTMTAKRRTGMLLGKFLPPHVGHLHLMDFAREYMRRANRHTNVANANAGSADAAGDADADGQRECDRALTIVVGTLAREPIPGELRYAWMKELAPSASVLHLTDDLPQEPSEHPDFWTIWRTTLERILPTRPDFVFASEPYGATLAEVLGSVFVPVDPSRVGVPISGSAIRADPMKHWDRIPRCVRPYFVKRVCIFGPESTGKSTLSNDLAAAFDTVAVPEYARTLLDAYPADAHPIDVTTIERIAQGQLASEDALARSANRILFCDTDILTTTIWSDVLVGVGRCPTWIAEQAARRRYDLTLLTDIDIPWVADPVRFRPDDRVGFLDRCERALREAGRPYVRISGSREERLQTARRAVEAMLATPK